MKLSDKFKIESEFESFFKFEDKSEELEHEKIILSLKFLSEIQAIIEEKALTKKEIAHKLETSASYITQLFKGDRLVNMEILVKFQQYLDFSFDIKAITNNSEYRTSQIIYPFRYKSIEINNGKYFKTIDNIGYKREKKEPELVSKLETA